MILTIFFGAIASWIWVIGRLLRGESLLPETPLLDRREPPWGLGTILLILVTYIFGMYAASAWYARREAGGTPQGGRGGTGPGGSGGGQRARSGGGQQEA